MYHYQTALRDPTLLPEPGAGNANRSEEFLAPVPESVLKKVGLDLSSPTFVHGQLYVALSRGTSVSNMHVFLQNY